MPDAYDVYLRLPDQIWLYPRGKRFEGDDDTKTGQYKIKNLEITENGIYQYLEGVPYPRKGYSDVRIVRAVGAVKKAVLMIAKFLYHTPYLIPIAWLLRKRILYYFARFSHRVLRDYYWIHQAYLPTSKEIFEKLGEVDFDLAMFIKMFWEFDDTYRFRGQFFLSNIRRADLIISPKKELGRLCNLMVERERIGGMKEKWRIIMKGFISFLPIKWLVDYLLKLDLLKFRMDESDKYFAGLKGDFDYV